MFASLFVLTLSARSLMPCTTREMLPTAVVAIHTLTEKDIMSQGALWSLRLVISPVGRNRCVAAAASQFDFATK